MRSKMNYFIAFVICLILYLTASPFLFILWILGINTPFFTLYACLDDMLSDACE